MGKVRVYELAKDLGLDSKTLTARLIEMGYPVKAHNSTLDEEAVAEIRRKLSGEEPAVPAPEVVTEDLSEDRTVEEKRIQRKGTTIIRRRTKAVPIAEAPSHGAPPVPAEEPIAEAAAPEEPAPAPLVEEKAAEPVPAPGPEPEPVMEVPAVEGPVAAEPEREEAAAGENEEPQAVPLAAEAPRPEAAPAAAAPAPGPVRKGLARVIKRAAIALPVEKEERPRPKKPIEKPRKRPETEARPAPGPAPAAAEEQPKGKKGKRFVQFQPEAGPKERARKATGKRQGGIELDVEDIQELGGRLPISGLRVGGRGRRLVKKKKLEVAEAAETKAIKKRIKVLESISVGDMAHRMGVKAGEVIAKLMGLGIMATVNQTLDAETAAVIATDFGYEVEQGVTEEQAVLNLEEQEVGGQAKPRPPVVTVMGHVDHGKTSILDAIRKTDVAAGEAGGITQHIGAHYVRSAKGDVVFLDTPGHAAFTEMRARGAKVTDVVVLVVAADDGVMDQTREAISHARAAQVPIVVAVNKIDKPDADSMRVMRELSELGLMPEQWGGDVIFCETSAKKNIGIDELLEQILLQAEILELQADPDRRARGWVVEAQMHKGRGPLATVLVQQGTLRVGDVVVAGLYSGKVRSLNDDKGKQVKEAGPAMPVEVQGLSGVPQAGDEFIVVPDEKMAKSLSSQRQLKAREAELATTSKISLENLFEKLQEAETKELRVVLRADVQGTLEAFSEALQNLSTEQVRVRVLHQGTGTIIESDVLLAAASDALIIGFNVRPSSKVQELAKKEGVDIRAYDVIYHALDDIRAAMTGMLAPTYEEEVIGSVEVRETFQVPKVGTIAGCYVTTGKVERNARVRLLRDGVVVYTGKLASLKRFKDDVREVQTGYECGLGIENYNDVKVGDQLEVYVMKEVAGVL
ncbi:MAG: translation initiation factor IF-2 [Desulfobacteraceae bacterium]|nr:translation initiation factor IF-2 [Desulfobacteraceae bacterium]